MPSNDCNETPDTLNDATDGTTTFTKADYAVDHPIAFIHLPKSG